jgi:lipoprotein NlpI
MREGGESRGFSFDSLDFRDFAFTTGFASSLTKRIFVRGFNYIQFRFVSEGDTDASIGAFEAEYSILTSKGGLR